MKRVGVSISLSTKTIMRIEEYIEEHGGTFSRFMETAAASYLDHNQTVSKIVINDSEQDNSVSTEGHVSVPQVIESTPETNKNPNMDFSWDDVELDK